MSYPEIGRFVPLVSTLTIVEAAAECGAAAFAFNIGGLEMAQGVIAAAEATAKPVIIQLNRAGLKQMDGARAAAAAILPLAEAATAGVSLHLDHADTVEELELAIAAGFTSLMIDGSTLSFDDHIKLGRRAQTVAAAAGCPLEAELGHVSGNEAGVTLAQGTFTDPDQAARFVSECGIAMLAVSIGNVHGRAPTDQALDLDLLQRIRDAVDVPLVLHGASGIPPGQIETAVALGIAKINVGTGLRIAFDRGRRTALEKMNDPQRALAAGRDAAQDYAGSLMDARYAI